MMPPPQNVTPRWQAVARLLARFIAWLRTWRPAILLGVLTVGSYGLVLYGFGVLTGPMQDDEGWSSGAVNAAFMGAYLLGAAASLLSGRILDAVGPRPVLWSGLIAGTALLIAASWADQIWLFIALWTLGGAITIAGLFYNVTMPITARLYPDRQTAAMTVLVTTGGLSSVVFLPLTGLLTEELGWRWAVRALLVLAAVLALPAALTVRRLPLLPPSDATTAPTGQSGQPAQHGFSTIRDALRSREVQLIFLMVIASSFGLGALNNHFVPAATAAGLSLPVGAALTGLRGLLSLPGRAMIGPMSSRLGLRPALGVAYAFMLLGMLALLAAGPIWWVYLSAVTTGLVWGQTMPLQGLIAAEVFGLRRLGTLMALQTSLGNIALAIGPFAAGVLLDAVDDDYQPVLIAIAVTNALTLLILITIARGHAQSTKRLALP